MNSASELYRQFRADSRQVTGKTIDEWMPLLRTPQLTRHSDRMAFLQTQHALPYRVAYLLASHADETRPDYSDSAGLIEAMYSTRKSLRPVHDALTDLVMSQGADVTDSIAKTMVTFRRKHVFAQIKPAAKNRIDFGLALPELETQPRLIATGGLEKGDRITYRIPIQSIEDIDRNLEEWLERAYQATSPGRA